MLRSRQRVVKAKPASLRMTHHAKSTVANDEKPIGAPSSKDSSEPVGGWRRNAILVAVGSVVAAACGYVALRTVALRKGSAKRDKEEAKLDLSLEQAGNTSEPTAKY